jgi:hypothetical protein
MFQVQGRSLQAAEVASISQLIQAHPEWSRRRISEQLARQWDWRNGAGQLKDMAARSLLLKLEERGLIRLPPRRRQPTNRMRCRPVASAPWDQDPIVCPLAALAPLAVREVSADRAARALWASALDQFHYLGHGGPVGENLGYEVRDRQGRPLAFLRFGSAAWKCRDRDRFIGWDAGQRARNLGWLTNNSRFLILPWVRVPHLASWSLSQVTRRLSADWQGKYGHGIALVETFVERGRLAGTAYRAANWRKVGATTGRTRQDPYKLRQAPVKDIYVYALRPDFREVLCA